MTIDIISVNRQHLYFLSYVNVCVCVCIAMQGRSAYRTHYSFSAPSIQLYVVLRYEWRKKESLTMFAEKIHYNVVPSSLVGGRNAVKTG